LPHSPRSNPALGCQLGFCLTAFGPRAMAGWNESDGVPTVAGIRKGFAVKLNSAPQAIKFDATEGRRRHR
jgi:hypothetical protein